jgi:hypothetical protein
MGIGSRATQVRCDTGIRVGESEMMALVDQTADQSTRGSDGRQARKTRSAQDTAHAVIFGRFA